MGPITIRAGDGTQRRGGLMRVNYKTEQIRVQSGHTTDGFDSL